MFMLSFHRLSFISFIAFHSYYSRNLSFASVHLLIVSAPETTGYDLVLITVEGTVKDV